MTARQPWGQMAHHHLSDVVRPRLRESFQAASDTPSSHLRALGHTNWGFGTQLQLANRPTVDEFQITTVSSQCSVEKKGGN